MRLLLNSCFYSWTARAFPLSGAVFLFVLTWAVLGMGTSVAQYFDQGPVASVIEENDFIVNTDRHYTQGIKLSYLHHDNRLPEWLARPVSALPAFGFEPQADRLGFQLGQNIYTPSDTSTTDLLPEDRPYAGWLYAGFVLQRRGLSWFDWPMLESFQLDAGWIGPWSLAENAQNWVHEVRGLDTANGWHHQLKNEPGVALKYERTWLISHRYEGPRYVDFLPNAGLSLGNVETSLRFGGTIRFGLNLPPDYGLRTIDSLSITDGGMSRSQRKRHWGFYFFTGAEGRVEFYTAFLDGNLARTSHHVERELLVGDWKSGFTVVLNRVELGYIYVFRTPEFVGQTESDGFGSFVFRYKF